MSTVSERWVSGGVGFIDKTLKCCCHRGSVESQHNTVHSSVPREEPKWWAQKRKNTNREQHWLRVKHPPRRSKCVFVHVEKSRWNSCPLSTEEATRFMSTKWKDLNTQHIDLKKKRARGWVNTHYDFCKRMIWKGAQCCQWKPPAGWLLPPWNNTVIHSTDRTPTVYYSVYPDVQFTYNHTTKSKR